MIDTDNVYRKVWSLASHFPVIGGKTVRNVASGVRTDDLVIIKFDVPRDADLLQININYFNSSEYLFDWAISRTPGDFSVVNNFYGSHEFDIDLELSSKPESLGVEYYIPPETYYLNLAFVDYDRQKLVTLEYNFSRPWA